MASSLPSVSISKLRIPSALIAFGSMACTGSAWHVRLLFADEFDDGVDDNDDDDADGHDGGDDGAGNDEGLGNTWVRSCAEEGGL